MKTESRAMVREFAETPEKRLLTALIASVDLQDITDQRWLESESEEPFSFRWVCLHLDLEPNFNALAEILQSFKSETKMYHKDYGYVSIRCGQLVSIEDHGKNKAGRWLQARVIGWNDEEKTVTVRLVQDAGGTYRRPIDKILIRSLQPKRNTDAEVPA